MKLKMGQLVSAKIESDVPANSAGKPKGQTTEQCVSSLEVTVDRIITKTKLYHQCVLAINCRQNITRKELCK